MTGKRPFTLLEVLAVMAIVGILTAILLPALSKATTRARIKATTAEMTRVRAALDEYYEDHGRYPYENLPGTGQTLYIVKAALDEYYEADLYTKGDKWVDSWGTEVHYILRNMKVMLISYGPDRKPGIADFDDDGVADSDGDGEVDDGADAGWSGTDDIVVR